MTMPNSLFSPLQQRREPGDGLLLERRYHVLVDGLRGPRVLVPVSG
jgi:hypothetical protein